MKALKIAAASVGLVIYSMIARVIIFVLLFFGVKSGWGWFVFCFSEIIIFISYLLAIFYTCIFEWAYSSRFAAFFVAILITVNNLLVGLSLYNLYPKNGPALTGLQFLFLLGQEVFLFYMCHEACVRHHHD